MLALKTLAKGLVAIFAFLLVVGACSDGDSTTSSTTSSVTSTTTTSTTRTSTTTPSTEPTTEPAAFRHDTDIYADVDVDRHRHNIVDAPNPDVAPQNFFATPPPAPEPAPAPAPAPVATYYKNCAAVRAAGAAPIYAGQPGYRSKLDRDGDGIACE
ncbi:excalibur calcium-binding domain-containing protein [Corynebacterium diphtheriae]